jgi:glycosyltransferase involved in cell wall biosynthesis
VEPGSPQALAEAVLLALDNPELRSNATELNLEIIRSRAESGLVRTQVECFYRRFVPETLRLEALETGDTQRISTEE